MPTIDKKKRKDRIMKIGTVIWNIVWPLGGIHAI
jgi:hypothetical protein